MSDSAIERLSKYVITFGILGFFSFTYFKFFFNLFFCIFIIILIFLDQSYLNENIINLFKYLLNFYTELKKYGGR